LRTFEASYFDGRSSTARTVSVSIDEDALVRICGAGLELAYPLTKVKISARIGDAPRWVVLPNGAKCETRDNDAVDQAAAAHRVGAAARWLHAFEIRLPLVIGALITTLLLGWATIEYGVPYLARQVARGLPSEVDQQLGREALALLDDLIFEPSELDPAVRARLRVRFNELAAATRSEGVVRLVFRASPTIGANALALPSGTVVMTDELVHLAAHEDEVIAVLAHELGHIHGRHALRSVLQHSATVVLIAVATGDLASLSTLFAVLPAFLLEMKYSRAFDLEADDYAVAALPQIGIAPDRLAAILRRLQLAARGREDETSDGDNLLLDYISTHPATEERVRRLTKRRN
jgi:Zn-dependent protease with chaperone function